DGTDAFAAAHGGGGRKSAATGTVGLVLLNSTDGVAHWGQQVTFNVSTTATTEPHVGLKCSQSSVVVYSAQSGYYASYPWPAAHLTPDDRRMARSVEALYGPPRWSRGDWQNDLGIARLRTKIAAQPLGPVVRRTLLMAAVAFFAWYAFLGGAASLRYAVSFA